MRIYINNINLEALEEIANRFKDYLVETEHYVELYTHEGIYKIGDEKVYHLNPCDDDIQMFDKYFNKFTLIVDPSYYEKKECFSIHGDNHVSFRIKKMTYKLNRKIDLTLVIEFSQQNDNKFVPRNLYFETKKKVDINELFIKSEIITFLSIFE